MHCDQGEMSRQCLIRDYFPTFVRRLLQSTGYKKSVFVPFNLAFSAGSLKGIKDGRSPEDVQAILDASSNFDLEAYDKLYPAYDELFVNRYPFVDKVANAYRQTPAELQNLLPDKSPPTPGQGPTESTQPYSFVVF